MSQLDHLVARTRPLSSTCRSVLASALLANASLISASPLPGTERPAARDDVLAGQQLATTTLSIDAASPREPLRVDEPRQLQQRLGLALKAIDQANRQRYGVRADQAGVLVTGIRSDGAAAVSGLHPGDIIFQVEGEAIEAPADLLTVLQQLQASCRRIHLTVRREGRAHTLTIPAAAMCRPMDGRHPSGPRSADSGRPI